MQFRRGSPCHVQNSKKRRLLLSSHELATMAERRKRSDSILSIYFHDNHDPSWMHADNWALDYWVRKSCCVTTDLVRTFRSSVLFFFFLKEERKIYRFIQSIKLKSKIFLKYLDSFLYWLSSILLIVINIWIHEILFIFSSSQLEILQDLKRTFFCSFLKEERKIYRFTRKHIQSTKWNRKFFKIS